MVDSLSHLSITEKHYLIRQLNKLRSTVYRFGKTTNKLKIGAST